MADNTTLDPGTGGDVIATDDVAGVKYQQVKLVNGTLDSTQVISSGNGTNAAALRVTVASDSTGVIGVTDNSGSLTVDNGGTFAVQESQVVVDNAGFTDGTTKVFPVGYVFDEVAGTALTENDAAAARIDAKRAQVGVLEDATTRGQRAAISAAGRLSVDASGVAVPITDNSGSLTVDNAGTFAVQNAPQAQTTGGLTIGPASGAKLLSAASTNATSVKGSAGQVYGWYLYNANAAVRYMKLYNKATSPTVGTDVPVMVVPIPPGAAANVEYHMGIAFGTGIALALTTGVADADTGAVAANEIVVNLLFK